MSRNKEFEDSMDALNRNIATNSTLGVYTVIVNILRLMWKEIQDSKKKNV